MADDKATNSTDAAIDVAVDLALDDLADRWHTEFSQLLAPDNDAYTDAIDRAEAQLIERLQATQHAYAHAMGHQPVLGPADAAANQLQTLLKQLVKLTGTRWSGTVGNLINSLLLRGIERSVGIRLTPEQRADVLAG